MSFLTKTHKSGSAKNLLGSGFIKLAAALTLGTSMLASNAHAVDRDNSYTLMVNQDSFFGFYPTFNGLVPMTETIDFSFYGILWTTPSFGTGGGNDLWTEFGGGANFHLMDGKLMVKPQIGITNGVLLSTGNPTAGGGNDGGNFADGVVPSLTVNYSDDQWEAEWYSGYYAALRNRSDNGANDFLHLWANGGYKFLPFMSAGIHYEHLDLTVAERAPGVTATGTVYEWIGGYIQFKTDNGMFARLTGGSEIQTGSSADFYKLNVGMTW